MNNPTKDFLTAIEKNDYEKVKYHITHGAVHLSRDGCVTYALKFRHWDIIALILENCPNHEFSKNYEKILNIICDIKIKSHCNKEISNYMIRPTHEIIQKLLSIISKSKNHGHLIVHNQNNTSYIQKKIIHEFYNCVYSNNVDDSKNIILHFPQILCNNFICDYYVYSQSNIYYWISENSSIELIKFIIDLGYPIAQFLRNTNNCMFIFPDPNTIELLLNHCNIYEPCGILENQSCFEFFLNMKKLSKLNSYQNEVKRNMTKNKNLLLKKINKDREEISNILTQVIKNEDIAKLVMYRWGSCAPP